MTGALAIINDGGKDYVPSYEVHDTPTIKVARKNTMDLAAVSRLLQPFVMNLVPISTALEEVHSMPKQGVTSSFSFGMNFGQWQGLLSGYDMEWETVTPQVWKRTFGLIGKDKDASRLIASRLFPTLDLTKKKDIGKADALLIAEHLRRQPVWRNDDLPGVSPS